MAIVSQLCVTNVFLCVRDGHFENCVASVHCFCVINVCFVLNSLKIRFELQSNVARDIQHAYVCTYVTNTCVCSRLHVFVMYACMSVSKCLCTV